MLKSTKAFNEWFKKSKMHGVWFPYGVSQKTFQSYLVKAYKAGYEQGLKDSENNTDVEGH